MTCLVCGSALPADYKEEPLVFDTCAPCKRTLPPSLMKATYDAFTYALRLRTGEIIAFREAKIHGEFVTLILDENGRNDSRHYNDFSFERGLDVRLSDIVWCADAPDGS